MGATSSHGAIETRLTEITRQAINLADARLGAAGISCTDEFFAPLARMLEPTEPVFIPGKYDAHGKWMDGWESRRRRGGGHDSCVVRLAAPGEIIAVEIDTRHFTGNYPPLRRWRVATGTLTPPYGPCWCPRPSWVPTRSTCLRSRATAPSVTSASTSFPMAEWHACAFTAGHVQTGGRSLRASRWISPARYMVHWRWHGAIRTMGIPTTCLDPTGAGIWATVGRPGAAGNPAMTGA